MLWPNSKCLISLRPAYINQFNMADLTLFKKIFRNNFCIPACFYFSLSTSLTCADVYRPQTMRRSPRGEGRVRRGAGGYWTVLGRSDILFYYCTERSEQVNCANAFRMGSSNSLFAIKSCACALSRISWCVESTQHPVITTVLSLHLIDHHHAIN